MTNRLARETSPYLLQHANNPVDWYPWGREALGRARAEQKPILLSVGYAACHWCHVMERESFEDEETARLMNEHFINIKVDREERPDIDAIYMQAVQAMTGHGGWPMTVVMTPEGVPFFGGTYFPPEPRHGMPSFRRVLGALADAWGSRRDDIEKTVVAMRQLYAAASEQTTSSGSIGPELLDESYRGLVRSFDERHGGFGSAPKFPSAMALDALLRRWGRTGEEHALEMATRSFRAMARGGIYDQVGGGFHRYSVDAEWLVPHFEKMLYDNALLVRLGTHLWLATRDEEAASIVEETIGWLAREMTDGDGGFYATMDADSDGEEGKFYVWSAVEFDASLGEAAPLPRAYWGVTDGGNFEGANILHVHDDPRVVAARHDVSPEELAKRLADARKILYEARAQRTGPARDEKMIAGWNALMIRALAEAARAFDRADWREMAIRAGDWLFSELVSDGRVMHVRTAGVTSDVRGLLDDHAASGLAALALYELTFDRAWLDRATRLAGSMVDHFWDDSVNAFFDTADDHEELVTRPRDVTDNATPSGTSLAVDLLLRVSEVTQDADHRRRAGYVLETLSDLAPRHPTAFGNLLSAADAAVNGALEVAIVGDPASDEFRDLARTVSRRYFPALALAGGMEKGSDDIALLAGRTARGGRATAYVCRHYTCDEPVSDAAALELQLDRISAGTSEERS
jgi:uncharacterized protein